jgi:hypothetical protein
MKISQIKQIIDEVVKEETLNTSEMEGPYSVHVKKGRLAGQTVMANKQKTTGVYYYLNPDTATDEPIGKEGIDLDVQKKQEEGVGYVYAKDRASDPKSIKTNGGTEHWRIKFQSARDLKKHGNTEKSKVAEAYDPLISGPGGDKLGRTPTDEKELRDMIVGMTTGQSILFHSQQGVRGPMIHITKLRGDSYEVEDQTKKKQTINRESQIDNLIDVILKQVNVLSRAWIRTETLQQVQSVKVINYIKEIK